MIRGITVLRANVIPAICDPVQWSDNLQLAINNGTSLSVLEPTLPSIHQSIIPLTANTSDHGNKASLDSKSLFTMTNVIHSDVVSTWALRKFLGIEITTGDEKLTFGKFSDAPLIVSHKWSPPLAHTKNCQLAILLNTSELLVLERSTIESDYYEINWNFFDILLEGLQLPQTSFTGKGEIKLSNEQFLSLKVISFCYSPSNYPLNGNLYICLATANNTISIFQSNNRKLIYDLNNEIKNNIVKLIWSPWKGSMSTLCVITALNEIFLLDISETAGELLASNLRLVQPASRFLISQVHWYNLLILLIGSTNAFKLYDDGDNQLHSYTLSKTHDLITGIVTSKQVLALTSFDIHLSFEHGQFECLQYNFKTHKISLTNSTSALQQLVNQLLYKYQLSQSVAIGEAPVNHNYLNDIVEGTLYNYGAKLNGSVIALVTRIVPKNVLNYTILSKIDYRIDFIPYNRLFNANPLSFNNVNSSDTVQSALGWINKYWFNHFNDIPQIKIINEENAIQYCKSIKEFIEEKINFKETDDGRTTLSSISESFTLDPNVFKLQIQYNLYLIVLKTLNLLIEKTNSEELREPINQFEIELQLTQKKIFNKLARIVSAIDIDASQPFDNFVQKSYSQLLDDNNDDTMDIDDSGSTISIRTQFLTESFKPNGESKDVISSTTDHKWKRCNITLLPLLQLNHKTSEIGGFNYIINEFDQESKLLQEILTGLDYCVFSGNRAFKKR